MKNRTDSYGWAGKILWVDLGSGKISQVPTSDFEPEKYLGGVGINTRIFWEMGCPEVDGFHADNPIILSVGPLTGASGPFTRATVSSIAPQCYPDELFTYSGFGSKFPSELKYAGYDSIVIVGKADKPVYLSILDGEVEIKDAGSLWGLDTFETQRVLASSHPRASVLTIGPAGENLSRMAIIINETSGAAGQGGYGAVMGSKNLKAIVTRGTGTIKIARPDDFMELVNQRKAAGEWVAGERQLWARAPFPSDATNAKVNERYRKKSGGCYACPYQCHSVFDLPGVGRGAQMCNDNWYRYSSGNETVGESIEGMLEGNLLSQKLGLNNFELVATMLFFYRTIKETGLLTEKDFGLSSIPAMIRRKEPEFGTPEIHHEFLTELLSGIADGTSPLSSGIMRCAEQFGPEVLELAKAIQPAWGNRAHHIRGVGEALHWATDTRDPFNSCHDYTDGFGVHRDVADWFGVPGGYLIGEDEGKHQNIYEDTEKLTVWVQNAQSVKNSLTICEFASIPELFFHPPDMDIRIFEAGVLSAVTGIDVDVDELWKIGDRIWNLRRAVMIQREDRHKRDDEIYEGMFGQVFKIQSPELMSEPLDRDRWKALKDRYYELRGWNVETGRPKRAKLEELGMKDVADKLQTAGKLG